MDIRGKFFPERKLPRAVVGSPFLEGFQLCKCGSQGQDLVANLAVLGEWWDLMLLKIFLNLIL